jgi:hypothetical protein
MPAQSYGDMRRRRVTAARTALARIQRQATLMLADLDRDELPSASLVEDAVRLTAALAALDALEELQAIEAGEEQS